MIARNDKVDSKLEVTNERIDDVPLLLAQMKRMRLPELLDKYFPRHGNWQGLSLGWTTTIWLAHILSQGDHRLSHVQHWAETLLSTLSKSVGQVVRALDFSDDRLGDILKALSNSAIWSLFEAELSGQLIEVYDLRSEIIRLDSTSSSGYWKIVEEGIFQRGYSKDHRPDLPQLKIMFATLDPLGLPLVTTVVSGEISDSPLYLPAIAEARRAMGRRGLLYVGDSKMGSLQTRLEVAAEGDYYLCPLSSPQIQTKQLAKYIEPVIRKEQDLISVKRETANGTTEEIAIGYEITVEHKGEHKKEEYGWTERRLIVRSVANGNAEHIKLCNKVKKTAKEILTLNEVRTGASKRAWNIEKLIKAVEKITVKTDEIEKFLKITYEINEEILNVPGRIKRPAHEERRNVATVKVEIDEAGLAECKERLGWRVYGTNYPKEELSLEQAVLVYRKEYTIEHDMARLKGPLSIRPFYLEKEDHAIGLVKLLSIGLRVLNLTEYVVECSLGKEKKELRGLYRGNPKRATKRPSTELLLQAFKGLSLHKVELDGQMREYITPLSNLQKEIIACLGLGNEIYNFAAK